MNMCVECLDMGIDMYIDMCIDVCIDMYINVYGHVYRHVHRHVSMPCLVELRPAHQPHPRRSKGTGAVRRKLALCINMCIDMRMDHAAAI